MRLMTGLAAGLLLLGVAACGGSDDGTEIATAGGTPTASASASPGGGEGSFVKYAACMRENGIPMEDPETGSDGEAKVKLSIPQGVDKSTVDAAEKKCRPLMPNGGVMPKAQPEQMERMREMSRCMRENGFPAFPDPTPEGGIQLTPESGIASGLAGTLTKVAAVGTAVRRGGVLYRVDDEPVVLLYGGLPAYRPLSSGSSGRDVLQFERNLWALGYRGFTVDREYTWATAAAVREWQDDLGLDETGAVDPARVHYADGAARVHSLRAAKGDAVRPGTAVLALTGRERAVIVTLSVDDQRLARTGAKVGITLPDDARTTGKITGVETVVAPAKDENADPETELEVTISLDEPKAAGSLAEASVSVSFTAEVRENVLAVPVAALLALAEGGYGVEVVENGATRIVPVETGLFAVGARRPRRRAALDPDHRAVRGIAWLAGRDPAVDARRRLRRDTPDRRTGRSLPGDPSRPHGPDRGVEHALSAR